MQNLLHVLPHAEDIVNFLQPLVDDVRYVTGQQELVIEPNKNNIVLYGGGEDISPSLYGQTPSIYTSASASLSKRDWFEQDIFNKSVGKVKNLGICRGAQMLCVLSGGSLNQHVLGHTLDHEATITKTGESFLINSSHHQMMIPNEQFEIIMYSAVSRGGYNIAVKKLAVGVRPAIEPEICFVKDTKSLLIQGHPEWAISPAGYSKICANYIKEYLLSE
jgi:gamma-glutamyl-gamma-aminobutyrate hydrolase PuuD